MQAKVLGSQSHPWKWVWGEDGGGMSVHKPIQVESQAAKLFLIFACRNLSNKKAEARELREFKASLKCIFKASLSTW